MEHVVLTPWEARQAYLVGKWRREESRSKGLADTSETGMEGDVNGAGAEMALAKYLNVFWSFSVNTFKREADVGTLEVRSSDRHDYNLLLRPGDAQDSSWVLVTGRVEDRLYRIQGWARGSAIMTPDYWREIDNGRPGCWIYPSRLLSSPQSLKP